MPVDLSFVWEGGGDELIRSQTGKVTQTELALMLGVGEEALRERARKIGVEIRKTNWSPPGRNEQIIEMVKTGATQGTVAKRLKVSKNTVSGVVWRARKEGLL